MGTAPKTITAGQIKDLSSALLQAIPKDLSFETAQHWIGNKKELGDKIRMILLNGRVQESIVSLNWEKTYEALGMSSEYHSEITNLVISEDNSVWTIPVLKGLTCATVITALKKAGSEVYQYVEDLDKDVTVNDRDASRDGSYAISVKANLEADEEFKNKSANQLKKQNHKGITLLERLLLELACFLTIGNHLDIENVTLCSGSRSYYGHVPFVSWFPVSRGVDVDFCSADVSDGFLRSRSVSVLSVTSCKAGT